MKTTNQKDSKLAVVYARTSTTRGSVVLKAQLEAVKAYAKKHGYIIQDFYIDMSSEKDPNNRPMLKSLLEDAEKNNWGIVIISTRDRLSRNPIANERVEDELKRNGVKIISLDDSNQGIS